MFVVPQRRVWDEFNMRTELILVFISDIVLVAIQIVEYASDVDHTSGKSYGTLIFLRCCLFILVSNAVRHLVLARAPAFLFVKPLYFVSSSSVALPTNVQ